MHHPGTRMKGHSTVTAGTAAPQALHCRLALASDGSGHVTCGSHLWGRHLSPVCIASAGSRDRQLEAVVLYDNSVPPITCNPWHDMKHLGVDPHKMRLSYAHGFQHSDGSERVCVGFGQCAQDGHNVVRCAARRHLAVEGCMPPPDSHIVVYFLMHTCTYITSKTY